MTPPAFAAAERRPRREGHRKFFVALVLLTAVLCTACNTSARAQLIPTVPPQPTPNRTLDAVVNGRITIPTPTHATPTYPVVEPTRVAAPVPERPVATPTEANTRPSLPTVTRPPAEPANVATSTPRAVPTHTPTPVTIPTATMAPVRASSPVPNPPQRAPAPGALSDEPVGAVRAPPTPTRLREP